MKLASSKLSLLTEERRAAAISEIVDFFTTEREEKIGMLAAEEILDMFLDTIGIDLYNQAVDDTSEYIQKRMEELNADIVINIKK